jgi:cobalamin biosynthesis Co2+ chelatase CbiK
LFGKDELGRRQKLARFKDVVRNQIQTRESEGLEAVRSNQETSKLTESDQTYLAHQYIARTFLDSLAEKAHIELKLRSNHLACLGEYESLIAQVKQLTPKKVDFNLGQILLLTGLPSDLLSGLMKN